jgi:hypothetical protein
MNTSIIVEPGTNPLDVNITGGTIGADGKAYLYSGNEASAITATTVGAKVGIDSNIINASIDTHLYGKTSGGGSGTWKEVLLTPQGELITESQTQDGNGNAITSSLIGSKQSLDVNVANTTAIPVSGTFFQATQPVSIASTVPVSIASTVPVSGTFFQATQPVSIASTVAVSDSTTQSKIDTTNSTLSTIDGKVPSGLSVSSGSLNTNITNTPNVIMNVFNRTGAEDSNLTSVQPVGASTAVKALETYSYMVGLNNEFSVPLQITSTTGDTTQSLDVQIQNVKTTTNNKISGFPTNANIGLNMYVIPTKTQTFQFNAFTESTAENLAIGSNSSNIAFGTLSWGLANPKTWYMKIGGGSATNISITYTYIDTSGNEQTATAGPLTTAGFALPNSIITINKWKANKSLASTDVVQIMAGANTGLNSFAGGSLYETNNSLFTCPNNAIAWVQTVLFSANTVDNLRLYKWDVDGNRTVMYAWYAVSNTQAYATGEYGFGGYITAGETIGWAGQVSTTRKNVYSNIVCRYL